MIKNQEQSHVIYPSVDRILIDDPTDANFTFSSKKLGPEERLMLAVFENGIDQFKKNYRQLNRHQVNQFNEARKWIDSVDTSYLYSFESCCHVLGIDTNAIRLGLSKLINPHL